MVNCEGTVTGVCARADTLEECMKQCEDSDRCRYGYYISSPTRICLPMVGADFYPHYDPTFRWVPKDTLPGLKDIDVASFLEYKTPFFSDPDNPDSARFSNFPDPYNNTVYFTDQVRLKNIETNARLYTPDKSIHAETSEIPFIYFGEDPGSFLTVGYPNPYNPGFTVKSDLPFLRDFVLLLGGTNFILRSSGNYVGWLLRGNVEILARDQLQIHPIREEEGKVHVAYGSPFYLIYGQEGVLGLDPQKRLKIFRDSYENLKKAGQPVTFTFESLMSVYYCDENQKCQETLQANLEPGRPISSFEGRAAYRSPTCFGICPYSGEDLSALLPPGGGKQRVLFILSFAAFLLWVFLLWLFSKRKSR